MRNVHVNYLEADRKTGRYKYRRRIPKVLKDVLNRGNYYEKALGTKTMSEALVRYGPSVGQDANNDGVTVLSFLKKNEDPRDQKNQDCNEGGSQDVNTHGGRMTGRVWRFKLSLWMWAATSWAPTR